MEILVTMPQGKVKDTFIPGDVAMQIESLGKTVWNESEEQYGREELKEALRTADACITGWGCPLLDRDVLETAEKLRIVAHTGGSVATLVSEYLYDRGIKVISGNDIYAESVAEGVIAYILASLRSIPFYAGEVQEGRWATEDSYNEGLLGKTVGIVGYGMIARHLVKMLEPFRVKKKVFAQHVTEEMCRANNFEKAETLAEIFSTCDIISLHISRTPETYHLIGEELLQLMPEGALLVNTARGAVIDEKALEAELQKKRIKAVLDVYEEEPLPSSSKLRNLENVILIPHMAGPTVDRRRIVTTELLGDIRSFFKGGELKYEISREYARLMTR